MAKKVDEVSCEQMKRSSQKQEEPDWSSRARIFITTLPETLASGLMRVIGLGIYSSYRMRRRQDYHALVDKYHKEYSFCVVQMEQEILEIEFLRSAAATGNKPVQQDYTEWRQSRLSAVNKCRSLTKGFWREVDVLTWKYGKSFERELPFGKNDRSRFIETVKQLDHATCNNNDEDNKVTQQKK